MTLFTFCDTLIRNLSFTKNKIRFNSALLLVFFVGFSQPLYAQNQGRWYNVEVLIFKRLGKEADNSEYWPQDLTLQYPEKYRYISKTLSNKLHQLGGHSYSLNKSESYKVLFHKAWPQQMWDQKRSEALIIRGGENHGTHRELEGSIKIHIGRYLHLATDLWLSDYSGRNVTTSGENWLRLPKLPGATSNTSGDDSSFVYTKTPSRVTVLREKRRMRSKEVHYIDHPLMGLLVIMTPIKE